MNRVSKVTELFQQIDALDEELFGKPVPTNKIWAYRIGDYEDGWWFQEVEELTDNPKERQVIRQQRLIFEKIYRLTNAREKSQIHRNKGYLMQLRWTYDELKRYDLSDKEIAIAIGEDPSFIQKTTSSFKKLPQFAPGDPYPSRWDDDDVDMLEELEYVE